MDNRDGLAALADWLRGRSDETLADLLTRRPDLATPPPPDFEILAARLDMRVSVTRALERLNQFALEVAEALTVLPSPVSLRALREFSGGLDVAPTLRQLVDAGLVWGDEDAFQLVPMAIELLRDRPLGLGRPARVCLRGYRPTQLARIASALTGTAAGQRAGPAAAAGAPARVRLADEFDLVPTAERDGSAAERDASAAGQDGPAGQALYPRPGRPVRDPHDTIVDALSDPDRVRALVARRSPRAQDILRRLARGPALGDTAEAGRVLSVADVRTPVEELLAYGLLIGIAPDTVELPREVGLILRGEAPMGEVHPEPPALTGRAGSPDAVDGNAAQAAETLVRQVATVLEAWGDTPVAPLRTGGLSVRDLRAAARLIGADETVAAFVVELAHAAGLAEITLGADSRLMPTTGYDRWLAEATPGRWGLLAEAWMASTRVPGLVGERDDRGKPAAALSTDTRRAGAREPRRIVLAALGGAPPGLAVELDSLLAALTWLSPRRGGGRRDEMVAWTLREMELLGLTSGGALSSAGFALAAADGLLGRRELAAALEPMLPEPIDHILVQADLTAVAPGPLLPEIAAELAGLADVESSGVATVYRFTESSLRRALDTGREAAEIHAFLARVARTGVPQGLTYLIDDIARRHGLLRAGSAGCYLRCDDPGLLAEVVASRRTAQLGLRRIAPTVVVSGLPMAEVLDGLRAAGFAPAPEGPDGRVRFSRPTAHRTPARTPARGGVVGPPAGGPAGGSAGSAGVAGAAGPRGGPAGGGNAMLGVTRLLRQSDEMSRAARVARAVARAPGRGPAIYGAPRILAGLREAIRSGQRILLGYVDQQGGGADRIVRPLAFDGGFLTAIDAAPAAASPGAATTPNPRARPGRPAGAPRTFALHRITSLTLLDGDDLGTAAEELQAATDAAVDG